MLTRTQLCDVINSHVKGDETEVKRPSQSVDVDEAVPVGVMDQGIAALVNSPCVWPAGIKTTGHIDPVQDFLKLHSGDTTIDTSSKEV